MLVISVLVTTSPTTLKQIDEIWIHNLGCVDEAADIWKYRIEKPEGLEDTEMLHIRGDGYEPLLEEALRIIRRERGKDESNKSE